nr:hypothetical protein Cry52Nrm1_p070 [Cryptomonas curvata]
MKIKKGRISLKKEKSKHYIKDEASNIWKNRKKNILSFNNFNRSKLDPRPILNKSFISSCIYDITIFLRENGFDLNFTQNFFSKPTYSDFFQVILFLIQKIDTKFQFKGKIEEDIYFLLKVIKYPFLISKSSFYSISTPHTWAILISCLKWITELVAYQIRLEKENIIEIIAINSKKIFWEKMVIVYRNNILVNKTQKYLSRLLWSYCVLKICERKIFRKDKKKKNFNKKNKINFYRQILSLNFKFRCIVIKKINLFKFFFFFGNSGNVQNFFFISLSNFNYLKCNSKYLDFLLIEINKKRQNESLKIYEFKKEILFNFNNCKKKIELCCNFLNQFFKNVKKFESLIKFKFFYKTKILNLSATILFKSLFLLFRVSFCTRDNFDCKNFLLKIKYFIRIYRFFRSLKKLIKNKLYEFYRIRIFKDKIDNIFFVLRCKNLIIINKKYFLKLSKQEKKLNVKLKCNLLLNKYLDFINIIGILKNFLINFSILLHFKKKYIFVLVVRFFLCVFFLTKRTVFSLAFLMFNKFYIYKMIKKRLV